MRAIWIVGVIAVLSVSGCASNKGAAKPALTASSNTVSTTTQRPAWIDGEDPAWPRSRYLLGVGNAPDQGTADDAARAEIAKTFSVAVNVATRAEQTESDSVGNANAGSVFSSDVGSKIQTTTNKVLEGVEIVARWCDGGTAQNYNVPQCYALATLSKSQALRALSDRADEIDAAAKHNHEILVASADTYTSGMAAAQQAALAREMASINADARVLGGDAGGMFDFVAERPRIAQALAAMQVIIVTSGDTADIMAATLMAAMNDAGLIAKRGNSNSVADLLITADVDSAKEDAGDPRWFRYRSNAKVTFENRQHEVIASFVATAREDATSATQARLRSLKDLEKSVRDKARATVNDLLIGH